MDGAATQHSTRIDSCPLGPNARCSNEICGTNCYVQHHKNALAISDELYNSPREDDHIYVLWTDHPAGTYCSGSSSTHTSRDWIAVVMNNRPVINFMNICGADADNELACMALNLIHETAHCLYMYEAYNRPNHTRELVPFCVMNRFSLQTSYAFYLDVIYGDKQPFCDSCDEAMKNYTSNVVIEGNT